MQRWLTGLAPGATVQLTPVVDLIDHITPFVPLDDGGPPGQTSTTNLARLCRFHHRVKTHGDWHYQRDPDGTLTWTSPLGRVYTVDEHGTLPRY